VKVEAAGNALGLVEASATAEPLPLDQTGAIVALVKVPAAAK